MTLRSETNLIGPTLDHPLSASYDVLEYDDKSISFMTRGLRVMWTGEEFRAGRIAIGRCTGMGFHSTVRYNNPEQSMNFGRFTSIGARLRVILGGFHEMRSMSTSKVSGYNPRLRFGVEPQDVPMHVDIGSDVWVGDDVTIMAGSKVADGCVIGAGSLLPPNTRTFPYGIYAGTPARLIRKRFPEPVIDALMEFRWWELSVDDIETVQEYFSLDLTDDTRQTLRLIQLLSEATSSAPRTLPPTWIGA